MIWILLAISVVFGVLRLTLPVRGLDRRDIFKDMAHIWVGILLGCAITEGEWYIALPVALTVLEVVAAIIRKN